MHVVNLEPLMETDATDDAVSLVVKGLIEGLQASVTIVGTVAIRESGGVTLPLIYFYSEWLAHPEWMTSYTVVVGAGGKVDFTLTDVKRELTGVFSGLLVGPTMGEA